MKAAFTQQPGMKEPKNKLEKRKLLLNKKLEEWLYDIRSKQHGKSKQNKTFQKVLKEQEDMVLLERYRQWLLENHEKRIKHIEGKIFTEIIKERYTLRKRAEKTQAVETAKIIQPPKKKCVIS